MNAKTKQVFRPTITDAQMIETVGVLQHYKAVYGLPKHALEILVKFEKDLIGISHGVKPVAYVVSGMREATKISVENLSATSDDEVVRSPTHVTMAEDDLDAELERLNKAMLAELAAEGNQNVVLEDRRATPRTAQADGESSIDAELFKTLGD